jgi:putative nucleotidyltransferase with HDIG domain
MDVTEARALAERHLASALPRRWRHVQAVAHIADAISAAFGEDVDLLVSAAWLHDIGYAPDVAETGFHPLDGARYLRRLNADSRLVGLVAYHSAAHVEAGVRGLDDELAREFSREESATADALWYCDMTVGPDGQAVSVSQRLSEIRDRYGADDVVARSTARAEHDLTAAVRRTEDRLGVTAIEHG